MALRLESPAFAHGQAVPRKHTGDGEDVSPPLRWSGVPEGTRELALIVDDPDAPRAEPWVHWVLYGIPATAPGLDEGDAGRARQGVNDFRRPGWGGPAPPRGHGVHHYHFKLYALDVALDLPAGADKARLLRAMEGHVLAQGELVGTYQR